MFPHVYVYLYYGYTTRGYIYFSNQNEIKFIWNNEDKFSMYTLVTFFDKNLTWGK